MALPAPYPRSGHPLRFLLRKEPEYTRVEEVDGANRLRFLGTAGFVIDAHGRTVVIDPYVSRPGIAQTVAGRLVPDEVLISREIPRAHDVLVGHSHHDHSLDAPIVCKQTGARLVGSSSTLNIARAAGLPEAQYVEVNERRGGDSVACGPLTATAYRSRHGRVYLGRVSLPGDIPRPPSWPPHFTELRHGPVFVWHLDLAGATVLHVDSADYLDEELEGVRADVVCLCAIGRTYRRDYTRRIVELVRPEVVIPCHWDDFTLPYDVPPRQLPGVDVEGFVQEIRAAGARAIVLGFGQSWSW